MKKGCWLASFFSSAWYTGDKYFFAMEETELASKDDMMAAGDHIQSKRHASREGWYGAVLLGCVILLGIILIGGALWWAYTNVYLQAREEKSSIVGLSAERMAETTPAGEAEKAVVPVVIPVTPVASEATAADAKQEAVVVLNGGGIKGSAGTVAALLKQDGYTKVTTGNTTKDYTGVVVYHAADKATLAATVVKSLLKQYPKAVSKEAPKTDAEASSGAIVVIIGK